MYADSDPGAPPPRSTIQDVALEAGVSTATVSRVLNRSGRVSPETREVVLRAIERRAERGGLSVMMPTEEAACSAIVCSHVDRCEYTTPLGLPVVPLV